MENIDYENYMRSGEPEKQQRARNWATAIGLQKVDGLTTSEYLRVVATRNIEGDISLDESRRLIDSYYQRADSRREAEQDTEEADKVSQRIAEILASHTLDFTTGGLASVHRRLFTGVFSHAGQFRDYNITKREWVLRGETVYYLNHEDLTRAIDHDLQREREFDYTGLLPEQVVTHLSRFVADLWQIHPFAEGNTRTTAVFTIQYLRSLGYEVDNDMFAMHSWYFRNALVRANYRSAAKSVMTDVTFLDHFFSNLLLGTDYELRNRFMIVNPPAKWQNKYPTSTPQVPHKYPTSTPHLLSLYVDNNAALTVKDLMAGMKLKDRKNFIEAHLRPALAGGWLRMLYPDSPRHPRQKYLLTVKGAALLNHLRM